MAKYFIEVLLIAFKFWMKVEIAFGFCVLMKTDEYLRGTYYIYIVYQQRLLVSFFFFAVLCYCYMKRLFELLRENKYVLSFKELLIIEQG